MPKRVTVILLVIVVILLVIAAVAVFDGYSIGVTDHQTATALKLTNVPRFLTMTAVTAEPPGFNPGNFQPGKP